MFFDNELWNAAVALCLIRAMSALLIPNLKGLRAWYAPCWVVAMMYYPQIMEIVRAR